MHTPSHRGRSFLRALNDTTGWVGATRLVACAVAASVNALALGIQGNGNLFPSGLVLGTALGVAWSTTLLFGPAAFANRVPPRTHIVLWGFSIAAAAALLVLTCLKLWCAQ